MRRVRQTSVAGGEIDRTVLWRAYGIYRGSSGGRRHLLEDRVTARAPSPKASGSGSPPARHASDGPVALREMGSIRMHYLRPTEQDGTVSEGDAIVREPGHP